MMSKSKVERLVVISDPHCGCRFGLCPDVKAVSLDGGGTYKPSPQQRKVAGRWDEFWGEWVKDVTEGLPYAVVVNGDALDGVHHNSTTQISHNKADQQYIAETMLKPIVELCEGRFYVMRGTEAHTGQSGEDEERLAKALGAVPDQDGRYSRNEMWMRVGTRLVHILHHIGVSGSAHYRTSALSRELEEIYNESAKWCEEPPGAVVRSHRHVHDEVRIATKMGYSYCFVTAGWQLKTPFAYKVAGARVSTPQIGGIIQGPKDFYTRHQIWKLARPKVVTL